VHFCSTRHKPDFGGKSEAGKSEAIVSARQHRPEGQNPIASVASSRNAAQAWLRTKARRSMTWKTGLENWVGKLDWKTGNRLAKDLAKRSCSTKKSSNNRFELSKNALK
jgi:hypothetical protein